MTQWGRYRGIVGALDEPTGGKVPEVGRVIAWAGSRKAWRVDRVDDNHQSNWDPQTREAWQEAGEPPWETWSGRERRIGVEPPRNPHPDGKDRRGLRLCPWAKNEQWCYLEEPWPECVQCGLLWPCPCHDANVEADAAMADLDRLGRIMPGCCWACNEPVTGRQSSVEFAGVNLLLPGADPAVFHTSHSRKAARGPAGNQTCRGEAERYEQRWVAAEDGRTVRLRCPGDMWRHFGYRECTNPACPGAEATHRDWHHCDVSGYRSVVGADTVRRTERLLPITNCGHLGCKGPTTTESSPHPTMEGTPR